jgi:hypothetical protein
MIFDKGIAPERVAEQCGPRASRALVSVECVVDAENFYLLAKEARTQEGSHQCRLRDFLRFCSGFEKLPNDGRQVACEQGFKIQHCCDLLVGTEPLEREAAMRNGTPFVPGN